MIAASLREGDDLVDILLGKEADVNTKSRFLTVPVNGARAQRIRFHYSFQC